MKRSSTIEAFIDDGQSMAEFPSEWGRPPVGDMGDISFCVVELDYRTDVPNPNYDRRRADQVAVVDLHGVDREGHTILAHVYDFEPYFYCSVPMNFVDSQCSYFVSLMSSHGVIEAHLVEMTNLYYYQVGGPRRYLKITTKLPKDVAACRTFLESPDGSSLECFPGYNPTTYESNVDFVLRFMTDCDVTGMSWVTIPSGSYAKRSDHERKSLSQIELDTNYRTLVPHKPDGEWMDIPPLRILSFDIEVSGSPDHFPTPDQDPVIIIAAYLHIQGEKNHKFSAAFILNTSTPIVDSALYQFAKERDLLLAFQKFIQWVDPDIITGYNIRGFDLPYLVERSKILKCPEFCKLGRYKSEISESKQLKLQTKQLGKREGKDVEIPARIVYDMFIQVQNDYKLRSYTLNAVSAHFLGDQKEDVHYSMISKLHNGSPSDRHRLTVYCIKDSFLPLQLMDKLLSIVTSVELARVCKVPISYLLNRGQQIRVFSQILSKARERKMIIPAMKSLKSDEQYEGATVLNPHTGYFRNPISVLDFNSLYPSIMIAHNICYSTLINGPCDGVKFEESPNGQKFATHEQFPGVLPEILKELLAARKRTRAIMATEADPMKKAVLNGRQLALKVSANSVYGFTGATVGKLPCLAIAESVTGFGRMMIDRTKHTVEEKYNKKNGYLADAECIYGDTDSVMVNFGPYTMEKAIELGKEAASFVSTQFPPPINLEFEKAYLPYLLISMKHYAGLLWTNPNKPNYIDAKGIETVRRDNCRLVQNVAQKALNYLLLDQDVDKAISFVKSVVSDLLNDRIDLSFLVISKALTKNEDQYKAKQPHVALAERMAKRDPGNAPRLGDRIAYVIVEKTKENRAFEKSEEPIYVLEHGMQIDTKYYLENQLEGPLTRIFTPILGEDKVTSLLHGTHTLKVKKASVSRETGAKAVAGSLMSFVQVRESCLCGKAPVDKGKPPVCSQCANRITEVYQEKLKLLRYAEEEQGKLWTQCQRCQRSLTNVNICTACDCPIFYRRKKVQLDLEDAYKSIKRFDALLQKK